MALGLGLYCHLLVWHAHDSASAVFLLFHLDGDLLSISRQDLFIFFWNQRGEDLFKNKQTNKKYVLTGPSLKGAL